MLNTSLEFRKGILFVRLSGDFTNSEINKFDSKVKEVIIKAGCKYIVLNVSDIKSISSLGIKKIKELKKMIGKMNGEFFLIADNIKGLRKMVNIDNELNVFEKVVI